MEILGAVLFFVLLKELTRLRFTKQFVNLVSNSYVATMFYLSKKYVKLAFSTVIYSKHHIAG